MLSSVGPKLVHVYTNLAKLKASESEIQALIESTKEGKDQESINQVSHLTQDTNGKVTNTQSEITNESQEVSPFPVGNHKAHTKA